MLLHQLLENCAPSAVRAIRDGYRTALERLPYRRIWVVDTEFATGGDPHRTWCVCGLELRTGARFGLWTDGFRGPPPFTADRNTLFIAYVAGAEVACWHQLGWPTPERILDLFQEARVCTNTGAKSDPQGLVATCRHLGIGVIEFETKQAMQAEAQTRTVWPEKKQAELLSYCNSDVDATARLFLAVLPDRLRLYGSNPEAGLYFTLMRGECVAALGKAELRGLPVDREEWATLQAGRLGIFPAMAAGLPPDLRAIYHDSREGPAFNHAAFETVMEARGLASEWPRTPLSGCLSTSRTALKQMLGPVPELHALAEVMGAQSTVALLQWKVGKDGRCRN